MLTLKTYAHAIREEEADLTFANFVGSGVSERLYTSPDFEKSQDPNHNENAPGLSDRGRFESLEHETELEPATPTLARRCWG